MKKLALATHEKPSISPKMSFSAHTLIAILSFITALLLSESSSILAGATTGGDDAPFQQHDSQQQQQLQRTSDPSGRPQLLVAIYCGASPASGSSAALYYNQYLDVETRKWRSDRSDPSAICTRDKQAILDYCKKVYPHHDIRNIVESSRPYKLDNWCRLGASSKRRCRTRLTVRPYRCLEGAFQSDALLVPERCVFDHVHNKSVCESPEHWNKSAGDICHSKTMKLQSFGMLQPCGLGVFSGVEFVCCPSTSNNNNNNNNNNSDGSSSSSSPAPLKSSTGKSSSDQSDGNSFAQAANGVLANLPKSQPRYETEQGANEIKTDDAAAAKRAHQDAEENEDNNNNNNNNNSNNNNTASDDDDEDDEYDEDTDDDGYDDDSTSWNGDKSSSSSTTSTTSTTTTTTTTTTEKPMQRYLGHFDLAHERDNFRRAELDVQGSYQDKLSHVFSEWTKLDERYEEMKRTGDIQGAEEFKTRMTHQFEKTVKALEQESAAERHQLASMHAERAMAIINRRKKAAMDCLTQALDRVPTRARQVERCIVRLLKALEKDRAHTLRQYKNLLSLNTREALRERKIILDHLVTLNRAANQSIAMLDRSPKLVDKLKGKIVALWHKLRGIPLDEPIVRESEDRILNQLEEEVARRKLDHERERLAKQTKSSQERSEPSTKNYMIYAHDAKMGPKVNMREVYSDAANSNSSKSQPDSQNKPSVYQEQQGAITKPTVDVAIAESTTASIQQLPIVQVVSESQTNQAPLKSTASVEHNEINGGEKDRTHYQTESAGFAHLRMEAPYHELSYSVRHEPLHSRVKFGYSTALVTSFAAIVLLAFIGVKYYGKNSTRAYRRQGFAEVGRSCPEEKNVTHMQFNGYENPAYKYFEAEA